jgi:hypothetical protein
MGKQKQMDHRGCHRVRTGTRGGPFGTKGKGKRHLSRARRRAGRAYIRRKINQEHGR